MIELTRNSVNINSVAEILASAMLEDPLNVSIFPDYRERERYLKQMFLPEVCYCFKAGKVYATSERMEGVAMWLPDNSDKKHIFSLISCGALRLLFSLPVSSLSKLSSYNRFAKKIRKKYAPKGHWYLHNIAVRKGLRGKGFSGKLIKPILAKLDKSNTSCYLETQNPDNVPIYKHYGFRIVYEGPIPGLSNVKHWAMLS